MGFHYRKLVRESEWVRVYELTDPKRFLLESKFLVDNLQVSPSAIREKWSDLSENAKVEFASAFSSQPPRHADDQQILQFLMEVGPEEVWRSIAIVSAFHPSVDYALQFLLERIRQAPARRANYYQGLELLHRAEAIPLLRQRFDEYRNMVAAKHDHADEPSFWVDYLQCTKTLWTLTRDATFLAALKQGQTTAPPELRSLAGLLLREVEKGKG